MDMQKKLPNSTAVLVLGILSIVTCCCYGIVGIILAIIALVLASKDKKLLLESPMEYSEKSKKNLNAGRIMAIIGLIFSIFYVVYVIVIIATIGVEALSDPDAMQNFIDNL